VPLISAIGAPFPVEDCPGDTPPCPDFELPCPNFELPWPAPELPRPALELPRPDFELPCPELELPPPLGSVTVRTLVARIPDGIPHSAATVWFPADVSGGTVIWTAKLPPEPVTAAIGVRSSSSRTDVI
jgi:hypothetical protein